MTYLALGLVAGVVAISAFVCVVGYLGNRRIEGEGHALRDISRSYSYYTLGVHVGVLPQEHPETLADTRDMGDMRQHSAFGYAPLPIATGGQHTAVGHTLPLTTGGQHFKPPSTWSKKEETNGK